MPGLPQSGSGALIPNGRIAAHVGIAAHVWKDWSDMQRVAVIDNYDSFTYNLVQYLETLGARCSVLLNDRTDPAAITGLRPDGILLSPGPGTPDDAGVTLEVIRTFRGTVPILGVCLGHQCIAQSYGAKIVRASRLMHGKTSLIEHDGESIFEGLPLPFEATRYHSLVADETTLPRCLKVTARTPEGELMGLRHESQQVEGVQFHPESILTACGMRLIQNWLEAL